MYLIVKADPSKVKYVLKTNKDYQVGDKITGDPIMIAKLAASNADLFELGEAEKAPKKPKKVRGKNKQRKKFGPKHDKMMDGEINTKGK